jgi:FkbM family methyltransferase
MRGAKVVVIVENEKKGNKQMATLVHTLKTPLRWMYHIGNAYAVTRSANIELSSHEGYLELSRNDKVIRLSRKHLIYMPYIVDGFDHYYDAVEPLHIDGREIVDYSTPRFHQVRGFDLFPVLFSAHAEPLATTNQYLEALRIPEGGTVLDLGGYSGLTSMVFAMEVGNNGHVVCVEADKYNQACIRTNLTYFRRPHETAASILFEEKAIWTHNNGVTFSTDANMGSAVTNIFTRGEITVVPSITLSGLVQQHGLTRLDAIKCDIEGAEAYIFENEIDLLKQFQPTIILEAHLIGKRMSTEIFRPHLEAAGYELSEVPQLGTQLPLVVARPLSR